MKFLYVVALVGAFAAYSSALDCWTCINAASNEDCLANGQSITCQANEQACQNEVRTNGDALMITKTCKQPEACENNYIQNNRPAWLPTQCNLSNKHTVCRCCCNTDNCNQVLLGCLGATCPPIGAPTNGGISCTDDFNDQSVCTFTCAPGYLLNGDASTTCNIVDDSGTWTSAVPTCDPTTCSPQSAPANGAVSCTGDNFPGTVCSFTCDPGFLLQGSPETTCSDELTWTNPAPTCLGVNCLPPQDAPANGAVDCTDGNALGSVCAFSCNDGYRLVGDESRTCQDPNNDSIGEWTGTAPTCERITCEPPQVAPQDGAVDCTDSNFLGSSCFFSCNNGFALVGAGETDCVQVDNVAGWNNQAPVCRAITCNPPSSSPVNGAVDCTNSNNFDSLCSYTCGQGFALDGASERTCAASPSGGPDGTWTAPEPICQPISCLPAQTNPVDGTVDCTNGNQEDSECVFSCNRGYAMLGAPIIFCRENNTSPTWGSWTNPAPTCERIICQPDQVAPANGSVICTDGSFMDSVCSFTCIPSHALVGQPALTCLPDGNNVIGQWSGDAPTCVQIVCEPEQTDPDNGVVSCTDGNLLGSVCTYTCIEPYVVNGTTTTVCVDDGNSDPLGIWSDPVPNCMLQQCQPPRDSIENGSVVCTDSNNLNSVCTFTCDPSAILLGQPSNACIESGGAINWDFEPPLCLVP